MDIDCHILYLPDDDRTLFQKATESVRKAGIEPRLVEGIRGNIGASRAKAYETTNASLVCHVDSDDTVDSDWIEKLFKALTSDVCGSYSGITVNERKCYCAEDASGRFAERHLFHRALILPHLDELRTWPRFADLVTARLVGDTWVRADTYGYRWTINKRQINPALKRRYARFIGAV